LHVVPVGEGWAGGWVWVGLAVAVGEAGGPEGPAGPEGERVGVVGPVVAGARCVRVAEGDAEALGEDAEGEAEADGESCPVGADPGAPVPVGSPAVSVLEAEGKPAGPVSGPPPEPPSGPPENAAAESIATAPTTATAPTP